LFDIVGAAAVGIVGRRRTGVGEVASSAVSEVLNVKHIYCCLLNFYEFHQHIVLE